MEKTDNDSAVLEVESGTTTGTMEKLEAFESDEKAIGDIDHNDQKIDWEEQQKYFQAEIERLRAEVKKKKTVKKKKSIVKKNTKNSKNSGKKMKGVSEVETEDVSDGEPTRRAIIAERKKLEYLMRCREDRDRERDRRYDDSYQPEFYDDDELPWDNRRIRRRPIASIPIAIPRKYAFR